MPLISVILPVYNCAAYLEQSVGSILAQTEKNFELICINDGSTDSSLLLLQKFASLDPRVKILSRPNTGIVGALNDGLKIACGEYVARMDGDDISIPGRFGQQLDYLEHHPECVGVGSSVELIDPEGISICVKNLPQGHDEILHELVRGKVGALLHPTLMCRFTAIKQIGFYRQEAQWVEDLDLYLRLAALGRLANLPEVLLRYRRHTGNVTVVRFMELQNLVKSVLDTARRTAALQGTLIPDYTIGAPPVERNYRMDFSRMALVKRKYRTALVLAWKAVSFQTRRPQVWLNFLICLFGPVGAVFLRRRHGEFE